MGPYSESAFEDDIISRVAAEEDEGDNKVLTEKQKEEMLEDYQGTKNFFNSTGMANEMGKSWAQLTKEDVLSIENAYKEGAERSDEGEEPAPKKAPEKAPAEEPAEEPEEGETTATLTKKYLEVECKVQPPTKNHRPALWENMLGTVYAMNDQGKVQYFDYDYEGAKEFAGILDKNDIRLGKFSGKWGTLGANTIPKGKLVVWVEAKLDGKGRVMPVSTLGKKATVWQSGKDFDISKLKLGDTVLDRDGKPLDEPGRSITLNGGFADKKDQNKYITISKNNRLNNDLSIIQLSEEELKALVKCFKITASVKARQEDSLYESFTITLDLYDDTFSDDPTEGILNVLNKIRTDISRGGIEQFIGGKTVRDSNGNTVGKVELE